MEDWSKNLFETLETVATEVEQFFAGATEEFSQMLEELAKLSEELAEQVQNGFIEELEEYFGELVEPFIEVYRDFEVGEDEIDPLFVGYVDPTPTQQPACRGCRHYHGQVYGGNLLVCGMHPYGAESETCPDWESYGEEDREF